MTMKPTAELRQALRMPDHERTAPDAQCRIRRASSAALILVGLATGCVRSGQHDIVLEEHLNRTWRDQMLTYEFEAPRRTCHPESLQMDGPDGPLPVQISEVETWPGTAYVRRAKVAFYVSELEPLATQQYVLNYGSQGDAPAVASELKVETDGDLIEITTGRIGVRLLIGQRTFDPPAPLHTVPAPMHAVRLLDGTWTGGGTLYGDAAVEGYTAELTAAGPVFAEVTTTYRFSDGGTAAYRFRVPAGDRAITVDAESTQHRPDTGWDLTVGGDTVSFPRAVLVAHRNAQAREVPVALTPSGDAFAELSPWAGWWWGNYPTLLRLETDTAAGQIHLNSRDAGAWVDPQPLAQSADFRTWAPGSMGRVWGRMHAARLPLFAGQNGAVTLRSNHRQGVRRWTLSLNPDGQGQFETFTGGNQTAHTPNPRLDDVKDMILAWPERATANPRLLLNAAELQAAVERSPGLWNPEAELQALASTLDALGRIDFMRRPMAVAGQYDALINSDSVAPAQRSIYRAQAAYLLYRLASPLNWSVKRGYTSGNPNMSLSFAGNIGIMALALRDHPHSDAWIEDTIGKMDFWLDTVVDEHGYWPESSHYARVTWANMVHFGVAATRAGVRDYIGDPKFRKTAEFYEKTLTPGDPTRPTAVQPEPGTPAAAPRVNAPYGRGVRFDVWGFGGPLARAAAESYPEFSKTMQWSWEKAAYSAHRSHQPTALPQLYSNPDLPSQTPEWNSEFYTNLGYLLRQHVGTPDETYLLLSSRMARNADGEIWPADVGGIVKWFAHGQPVAGAFPRGPASHVMLVNRVSLAGNWDPETGDSPDNRYHTETHREEFAPLPAFDYAHVELEVTDTLAYGHDIRMPANVPAMPERDQTGEAPLYWHRQLMMVDDHTPGGMQYLVLRDTVTSPRPTQWHFWTLTEKVGTPEAAADRDAFLADKPGNRATALQTLQGDRFTALGQYGVDLDYFIAAPADTPRHTVRYGVGGGAYGARGRDTYQDLMHLQLPGQGAYFVAIAPRRADAAAAEFSAEGEGNVIRISGAFGNDIAFLSHEPSVASAGPATFDGTAAHVRDRGEGVTLNLGAGGAVVYDQWRLRAEAPAQMQATPGYLAVAVPEGFPGGAVRFNAPGTVTPPEVVEADVTIASDDDGWVLTLPGGARTIRFAHAP